MSHIEHHGRLTADPEVRFSAAGKPIASATIAVNERKRNDDGTWTDGEASFHNVTAFGQMAEAMAESLVKGDLVVATGEYKQRKYKTKEGENRTAHETILDDIGKSLKWLDKNAKPKQSAQGASSSYDESPPF